MCGRNGDLLLELQKKFRTVCLMSAVDLGLKFKIKVLILFARYPAPVGIRASSIMVLHKYSAVSQWLIASVTIMVLLPMQSSLAIGTVNVCRPDESHRSESSERKLSKIWPAARLETYQGTSEEEFMFLLNKIALTCRGNGCAGIQGEVLEFAYHRFVSTLKEMERNECKRRPGKSQSFAKHFMYLKMYLISKGFDNDIWKLLQEVTLTPNACEL